MSLLVVAAGVLVGLVLGALGGGGAVLTVPVLVYGLGMPPHTATTASLVVVCFASLAATLPHTRGGRVRWRQGLVFGVLGVGGSVLGGGLSRRADPDLLLLGFAVLLGVVAVLMWRGAAGGPRAAAETAAPSAAESAAQSAAESAAETATQRGAVVARETVRPSEQPGDPPVRAGEPPVVAGDPLSSRPRPRPLLVVLTATGVGLLTGFFGVGGGFAIVPALVLVLGFPMPAAVGTSLVVVVVNSATALGGRLGAGTQLDWAVVLLFTVLAMVGSLLGSRLAGRVRPQLQQRALAVLLATVAAYMAVRSGATLVA